MTNEIGNPANSSDELLHLRNRVAELERDLAEATARKEALKRRETEIRRMIEGISEVIFDVDRQGVLVYASPNVRDIWGYDREDFVGKSFADFVHPEDRKTIRDAFVKIRNGLDGPVNYRIKDKGGDFRWVRISAKARTENGEFVGASGLIFDITRQTQAEQALRESEEKYRYLVEHMSDIVWTLDMNMALTYVSNAVFGSLGFTPEERLRQNLAETMSPESYAKIMEVLAREIERDSTAPPDRSVVVETEYYHKDGHTVWIESRVSAIRDSAGKIVGLHGISRDMSDRRWAQAEKEKLEARARQLHKYESLSRMAGAIAHTFNNKLGAVLGNLEMALHSLPKDTLPARKLAAAMHSVHKAAEISGQMLTFLGQSFEKQERVDLVEFCKRSLPFLHASIPCAMTLETDFPVTAPVVVMGNTPEIQQVLSNLVTNGCEALGGSHGTIRLSVKKVSPADVPHLHRFPVDWQPEGEEYACMEVADTGGGIDPADMEKLFDPFFTRKFIGRGMGLSVALGIVKAHGGVITVESEEGRGSAFRTFLPLSREESASLPQQAVMNPLLRKSGAILLVEDDEVLREIAVEMIKHLGYPVVKVKDGAGAVEVFRQRRGEICLVISDLTMAGMDGWETLTALRKLAPDIPAILASGYDKVRVMAGDHPELPQVFLSKPYKIKELDSAISQALAGVSG